MLINWCVRVINTKSTTNHELWREIQIRLYVFPFSFSDAKELRFVNRTENEIFSTFTGFFSFYFLLSVSSRYAFFEKAITSWTTTRKWNKQNNILFFDSIFIYFLVKPSISYQIKVNIFFFLFLFSLICN